MHNIQALKRENQPQVISHWQTCILVLGWYLFRKGNNSMGFKNHNSLVHHCFIIEIVFELEKYLIETIFELIYKSCCLLPNALGWEEKPSGTTLRLMLSQLPQSGSFPGRSEKFQWMLILSTVGGLAPSVAFLRFLFSCVFYSLT